MKECFLLLVYMAGERSQGESFVSLKKKERRKGKEKKRKIVEFSEKGDSVQNVMLRRVCGQPSKEEERKKGGKKGILYYCFSDSQVEKRGENKKKRGFSRAPEKKKGGGGIATVRP